VRPFFCHSYALNGSTVGPPIPEPINGGEHLPTACSIKVAHVSHEGAERACRPATARRPVSSPVGQGSPRSPSERPLAVDGFRVTNCRRAARDMHLRRHDVQSVCTSLVIVERGSHTEELARRRQILARAKAP